MWPRPRLTSARSARRALVAVVLAALVAGGAGPAFADEPPPDVTLAPGASESLSLSVDPDGSAYLAGVGPTSEPSPIASPTQRPRHKGKRDRNRQRQRSVEAVTVTSLG